MMLFYFQRLIEIYPFFLKGLWMTVAVAGISLVLATILGLLLGLVRASENKFLVAIVGVYVAVIRGTPFVVQIFIVFFILPEWGIQLDAFPAAVIALTILGTAFICEIVAGGIKAVPKGQWEAASSSGLNLYQQLRYVVIPQSLQTILPPLVGQYVLLIKDSSVVSVIGVVELTRVGWVTVNRIPEGLMVFSLVGLLYFSISYPLIRLSNRLEKKMATQQVML
ncbi:amino acid ABC transporter permease [Desulfosarcina sp.]|uniref:amino acid ABC transporter permease n=1 Tax=Desulfosarcina sp. TaxID=2027861 RepID=UPI0029A071CB|nr:amino acid ABC transporter permease [Desulfosarcina sp.]MDX2451340.1 amino acid ABC transporter permease [Desulfosarcina sp.]MDX2489164.1 amino acid ABC transporter permease [Desulfosarcina sp.]